MTQNQKNTFLSEKIEQIYIDMRAELINDLGLQELQPGEQDKIITDLGNALIDRTTLTMMSMVPTEILSGVMEKTNNGETNKELIEQMFNDYIKNPEDVARKAFKEGIEDYKRYLGNNS